MQNEISTDNPTHSEEARNHDTLRKATQGMV